LLGIFGVAPKNFTIAKLLIIGPYSDDHATCVNRVVRHGECGDPCNLGGNCCIVIRAINIRRNGSFVAMVAGYGLGGNTKFCQSKLNIDVVCWMVTVDELIYGNKIKLTRHGPPEGMNPS
jgi:hypothetical protein